MQPASQTDSVLHNGGDVTSTFEVKLQVQGHKIGAFQKLLLLCLLSPPHRRRGMQPQFIKHWGQ